MIHTIIKDRLIHNDQPVISVVLAAYVDGHLDVITTILQFDYEKHTEETVMDHALQVLNFINGGYSLSQVERILQEIRYIRGGINNLEP